MTSTKVGEYFIDSNINYPEFVTLLGSNFIKKAESIMPIPEDIDTSILSDQEIANTKLSEYERMYLATASQFIWTVLSNRQFDIQILAHLNGTSERYMALEIRFQGFANTINTLRQESPRLVAELAAILEHSTESFTVEGLIEKFRGRGMGDFRTFIQSLILLVSPNDHIYKYYRKHVDAHAEFANHILRLNEDSSNLIELLTEYGVKKETIELIKSYAYNPDFLKALRSVASILKRADVESDNLDSNLTSAISRYGFGANDIKLLFEIFDLIKPFFGVNISTAECRAISRSLAIFYSQLNPNATNMLEPSSDPALATAFNIPNMQKLGLMILSDPLIQQSGRIHLADSIRNENEEQLEADRRMTYAAKIRAKINHFDFQRRYGDPYQSNIPEISDELIKEIAIAINDGIEYLAREFVKAEYIEPDALNRIAKTIFVEVGSSYVPNRIDETTFAQIFRAILEVIEDMERFITGTDRDEKVLDFGMIQNREVFEHKLTMNKLREFLNNNSPILNTLKANGLSTIWLLDLEMLINDGNLDAAASNIYQLFLNPTEQDYGLSDLTSILSWLKLFVGWVAGTMGRSDVYKLLINLVYSLAVDKEPPSIENLF